MLRTVEMKNVLIVGPDTCLKKVIDTLYNMGVMHIKEHKSTNELDICSPLPDSESLSESIVSIRAVADYLKIDLKKEIKSEKDSDIREIQKKVISLKENIKSIQEHITSLNEEIRQRESTLSEIAPLCKIDATFDMFREYKSLSHFAGTLTKPRGFLDDIKPITSRYLLIQKEDDNRIYFALFVLI